MDDLAKVAAAGDGESLEQVEERFRLWRKAAGVAIASLRRCGRRRLGSQGSTVCTGSRGHSILTTRI